MHKNFYFLRTNSMPASAILAIGCCILSACAGSLPRVTPAFVAVAKGLNVNTTAASLEAGRTLFVTRCGSCHNLPDPAAYRDPEWQTWVRRMAPKARIDRQQESLIVDYVLTARATLQSPPSQTAP